MSLSTQALVPQEGTAEMLQRIAGNVGDHLAAAAHNPRRPGAPMLEQCVFADGLRSESVAALNALAHQLWSGAFRQIVRDASQQCEQDRGQSGADQRVRIGM